MGDSYRHGNKARHHDRKGYDKRRDDRPRHHPRSDKPPSKTNVIASEEFEGENKRFTVRGISNSRGKAIEIREQSHGRENLVVIPMNEVDNLMDVIDAVMEKLEAGTEAAAQNE